MSTPTSADTGAARRSWILHDGLASLVVFLVALPLCMGIAIASGVPPARGLITGIIGGLVVGFLSGSPLQVSGPAAGLTVLVFGMIERFGIGMLGPMVLLAGLIQIAAAAVRAGRWFRAVPPSLVNGMLAGIGLLIILSQVYVLAEATPHGSGIDNILGIPALVKTTLIGESARSAALLGLLTIGIIVVWTKFRPQRLRLVPAPLIAILVASGVAALMGLPVKRVQLPESLVGATFLPTWESLRTLFEPAVLGTVVALALIASAETLLCANAVDRMHDGPRTKYDRELFAQGVGNTICGFLGALPMTGVIVRSSANIQAGATTRLSAILHGAWLLLLVAFGAVVLEAIPVASLAGVLVYTGIKLVDIKVVKALRPYGRGELAIFGATMIGIVAFNLLEGVGIGLLFALVRLLYHFSKLEIHVQDDPERNTTHVRMRGFATFLRVPDLAAKLDSLGTARRCHVELSELTYLDHASVVTISEWEKHRRGLGVHASVDWPESNGAPVARLSAGPQRAAPIIAGANAGEAA